MDRIWITGTGMTRFGQHAEARPEELAEVAGRQALAEAGIGPDDVDALYIGNFLSQSLHRQGVLASLIGQRLGLGAVPVTTVEGACASAGIALRQGVLACRAGAARHVLCLGVEHLSGFEVSVVTEALAEAMDQGTDGATGLTFPGFFGLVACDHARRFGTTREQIASVPVKNRRHGATNPLAMFNTPVDVKEVVSARLIADPLALFDCSPISDGAAAAVVSIEPGEGGRVEVLACEQSRGPASLHDIEDLTTFPATTHAAVQAYQAANVSPDDLDVVELHDCFSIAEIVDSEDLQLVPRGEGGPAIAEGATTYGIGKVVTNPSGGLLSRGHPVGATGLAQVHELALQLRGRASAQVADAELALAHNLGGCGATATVTILAGS